MIDKNKVFEGISPENIKENQKDLVKLVNYLNKSPISEKHSKKLEELIRSIVLAIEDYEDTLTKV